MSIPAAIFKAECLSIMDEVARTGQAVVITKHGRAVAQLVPMPVLPQSLFGYMKNTLTITGDVLSSGDDLWSAVSGDEDGIYRPTRKRRSGR